MQKKIVIITEFYPFKGGEAFLHDEFEELHKKFEVVLYFPLNKGDEMQCELPKNVHVLTCITDKSPVEGKLLGRPFYKIMSKIFRTELRYGKRPLEVFKHILYILSFSKQAYQNAIRVNEAVSKFGNNKEFLFYSTWMNMGSLVLSMLKDSGRINKFCFRVNGYDIFDERRRGQYMFLRAYNYRMTNKVVVLSEVGLKYILEKKVYPEKLAQNYSGIYKRGSNPYNPEATFTIVSCSSIIELKRLNLIVESLSFIEFPLRWYHFGDGPDRSAIEEQIQKLPPHIEVQIRGHVTQEELCEFYLSNSVDVFIHLSRTEGLGIAIIEAQSFGIPGLCCDAGGVKDVISKDSGLLVPVNTSPDKIASELAKFREEPWSTMEQRRKVEEAFLSKFEIRQNFEKLLEIFDSL